MRKPRIDHVTRETFLLWGVEFILCFLIVDRILDTSVVSEARRIAAPDFDLQAAEIALSICLISLVLGLYRPDVCLQIRATVVNAAAGAVLALPIILLLGPISGADLDQVAGQHLDCFAKILMAWGACLIVTRSLLTGATRMDLFVHRVILVGSNADVEWKHDFLTGKRNTFFRVIRVVPPAELATLRRADLKREKITGIIVSDRARSVIARGELLRCKMEGLQIFRDSEFCEQRLHRINIGELPHDWLVFADGSGPRRTNDAIWRIVDLVIGVVLLLVTLPITILVALAIKLDSSGPIFYRQERVGFHGRRFLLFKFRSMRVDAEAGGPAWASKRDARVTRVGRFLRRSRIDELPQVLNVLRGEMAFIGPRPERPHFVEMLNQAIPNYNDRASVKPGITGWAQVNYPYGASVEDAYMKLSYDLYYVKHRGTLLNLFILISTARVVLFQEGAR